MRLPTLFEAAKQDVPRPCPEDVNPGEAGLRQPLKLLDRRRGVVDVVLWHGKFVEVPLVGDKLAMGAVAAADLARLPLDLGVPGPRQVAPAPIVRRLDQIADQERPARRQLGCSSRKVPPCPARRGGGSPG